MENFVFHSVKVECYQEEKLKVREGIENNNYPVWCVFSEVAKRGK